MKAKIVVVLSTLIVICLGLFSLQSFALAEPLSRVRVYQISVGTTPVSLAPTSGYVPVSSFKLKNGATAIFCGGSDVDTSTKGWQYAASEIDVIEGSPGVVKCMTSSGSSTVTVFAGSRG